MDFIEKFFSKYSQEKLIKWFKQICLAEAISCVLLYCVAMIWIRYDENLYSIIFISVVGSLHGLFFTLYLLLCIPARKIYNWDDEDFVFALLAAFFPFATVWVDKKLAKFDRE
ncbi:DUF3817 domain-containing protein [Chryseobacterium jejuense]|uniref:Integral membrane protein n=1 Tax=Chryseobacterium jejuense TaxID=445960 RepID=A0A2X2X2L4_CHRJE|nr:DUF3817 domain-containing protein [Chryseobacterium jejuense]SDI52075.1 integral membrane protein [Chryseobacterium jejuense]SQB46914.1 integral membrane protein [Chryseobacterium jejuense]